MFDMGWSELLVIGVVALIVVGPKDLPILFRRAGQFAGKAKGMAREFTQAMNDAADESGMRDVSSSLNKSLKAATNPLGSAMDGVKNATKSLTDIDPKSETGKLAAKRAEEVKQIQASTARAAAERKQREAQEAITKAEEAEARLTAPAEVETSDAAVATPRVTKPAAAAVPAKVKATSPSVVEDTAAPASAPVDGPLPDEIKAPKAAKPKPAAKAKPAAKSASEDTPDAPRKTTARKPAAKKAPAENADPAKKST